MRPRGQGSKVKVIQRSEVTMPPEPEQGKNLHFRDPVTRRDRFPKGGLRPWELVRVGALGRG